MRHKKSCATVMFYKKRFTSDIIFENKNILNNILGQLLVSLYIHFLYTYIFI